MTGGRETGKHRSFRFKIYLTFSLFIAGMAVSILFLFVRHQQETLANEIAHRGDMLSRMLAENAMIGVFSGNAPLEFLKEIGEAKGFDFEKLTYFLPHLSSQYFAPRIDKEMIRMGLNIPVSKWFTNLSWVGNVGAASPYLMLEELFHSGKLNKGDILLMGIPESARFNYAYALLTVV